MNTLVTFKISPLESIKILVPELGLKDNLFYEPTSEIHKFDVVTFIYESPNRCSILFHDALIMGLENFMVALENLLNEELLIPKDFSIGFLGFLFNEITYFHTIANNEMIALYEMYYEENYPSFFYFALSTAHNGLQTFAYNVQDKMYLEIVPLYPWLHSEQEKQEDQLFDYFLFSDFMKTYKPEAVIELDEVTVRRWLDQCKVLWKVIWPYEEV